MPGPSATAAWWDHAVKTERPRGWRRKSKPTQVNGMRTKKRKALVQASCSFTRLLLIRGGLFMLPRPWACRFTEWGKKATVLGSAPRHESSAKPSGYLAFTLVIGDLSPKNTMIFSSSTSINLPVGHLSFTTPCPWGHLKKRILISRFS